MFPLHCKDTFSWYWFNLTGNSPNVLLFKITDSFSGRESSMRCNFRKHMQIKETTSSIWQHTRCKGSQHNQKKKRAANRKNTCKLRKHFHQFDNAHAANTHNTTKKENVSLFVCVVSICTICCQNDENVFLICWCFFYLHVFSEVAARWALSATVDSFNWKQLVLDL